MILYLDASALVKRYVDEPGSHRVDELIGRSRRDRRFLDWPC